MPLCQCCQSKSVELSAPYHGFTVHLCWDCFDKMKHLFRTPEARLEEAKRSYERSLASYKQSARDLCEVETLEYWWNLGEAVQNR